MATKLRQSIAEPCATQVVDQYDTARCAIHSLQKIQGLHAIEMMQKQCAHHHIVLAINIQVGKVVLMKRGARSLAMFFRICDGRIAAIPTFDRRSEADTCELLRQRDRDIAAAASQVENAQRSVNGFEAFGDATSENSSRAAEAVDALETFEGGLMQVDGQIRRIHQLAFQHSFV